jgi:hypothetical protein
MAKKKAAKNMSFFTGTHQFSMDWFFEAMSGYGQACQIFV